MGGSGILPGVILGRFAALPAPPTELVQHLAHRTDEVMRNHIGISLNPTDYRVDATSWSIPFVPDYPIAPSLL